MSTTLLILFGISSYFSRFGFSRSICLSVRKIIKDFVVIKRTYLIPNYKILSNILLSDLKSYAEEFLGNINVDIEITSYLLIILSTFVNCLIKMETQRSNASVILDFKKVYVSIS
jgi:hypothetical protein